MKNKIFLINVITIIILFIFTGCTINADEVETIDDKIEKEISYMEDEILTLINRYAKKEYIVDNTLNWDDIYKDSQKISNTIDVIVLDLSEAKLNNDEIVALSSQIDNLDIAISNKDESAFIQSCSYLYSLLPTYLEKVSDDKNRVELMNIKSMVISCFVQTNFLDWQGAKTSIGVIESKYKDMMNNIDYIQEYSYNLNKVYILIEEFKNAINLEEKELSRIKYINFIEKV